MPVHEEEGGYQWGHHGKVYHGPGAEKKAEEQAAAAHANGYTGDSAVEDETKREEEISRIIPEEIHHGHPQKQAEAIAYSETRDSLPETVSTDCIRNWRK